VIRAGKANMFLSNVFGQIMADLSNTPIELYDADGSVGAAIGAGIGAGLYKQPKEAFSQFKPIETIEPKSFEKYNGLYAQWNETLRKFITS
jgi:xylulokinase